MVTRADYIAALKREREFVTVRADGTYSEAMRAVQIAEIDAELNRFSEAPVKRGAPETRAVSKA